MRLKLFIIPALLLGCQQDSETASQCSEVAAIVGAESNFSTSKVGDYYYGKLTFELDENLAGQLMLGEGAGTTKRECRLFGIQARLGTDLWVSRHCFPKVAAKNVEAVLFSDSGNENKVRLKHFDEKKWSGVRRGLTEINIGAASQKVANSQSLIKPFLDHSDSAIHSGLWGEHVYSVWRGDVHNSEQLSSYGGQNFYKAALNKQNLQHLYAGRDFCSKLDNLSIAADGYQQLCLAPSDFIVLQTDVKLGRDRAKLTRTDLYKDWRKAVMKLDNAIDTFTFLEMVFQTKRLCYERGTTCEMQSSLNSISSSFELIAEDPGVFNSHYQSLTSTSSYARLLQNSDKPRGKVLKELDEFGLHWEGVAKIVLNKEAQLSLAGVFEKNNEAKLGHIDLREQFSSKTSTFSLLNDSIFWELHHADIRFEIEDTGSFLFVDNFPLASLRSVNGKSSIGGVSSLPEYVQPPSTNEPIENETTAETEKTEPSMDEDKDSLDDKEETNEDNTASDSAEDLAAEEDKSEVIARQNASADYTSTQAAKKKLDDERKSRKACN